MNPCIIVDNENEKSTMMVKTYIKRVFALLLLIVLPELEMHALTMDTLRCLAGSKEKYWERSESFLTGDRCVMGLCFKRDDGNWLRVMSYIEDNGRTWGAFSGDGNMVFSHKESFGTGALLLKRNILQDASRTCTRPSELSYRDAYRIVYLSPTKLVLQSCVLPKYKFVFHASRDQKTQISNPSSSDDFRGCKIVSSLEERRRIIEGVMADCKEAGVEYPDSFDVSIMVRVRADSTIVNGSYNKKMPDDCKFDRFYVALLKTLQKKLKFIPNRNWKTEETYPSTFLSFMLKY